MSHFYTPWKLQRLSEGFSEYRNVTWNGLKWVNIECESNFKTMSPSCKNKQNKNLFFISCSSVAM